MHRFRGAWLLIPLVGIVEAVAHGIFAARAPDARAWERLPASVDSIRQPGDLVVVAPAWAEPLARFALGDSVMPLEHVSRADASGHAFALEVSLFGERSPDLTDFTTEVAVLEAPPFVLRRLKSPAYRPVLYAFTDHVRPDHLSVTEPDGGSEKACPFTERARPTAGGLPGHPTYPRERFRCAGGEPFFVGVTVIDDQAYRPRRCIYAQPPRDGGPLRLRFSGVPLGREIRGYGGRPYLIFRDGVGAPVSVAAYVDGHKVGESIHPDEAGFSPFRFELGARSGLAEVVFEVTAAEPRYRQFCFTAEMR
jgi:hypothetical protein